MSFYPSSGAPLRRQPSGLRGRRAPYVARQRPPVCPPRAPNRSFDIVAMQLRLVVNKAGEFHQDGMIYALAGQADEIRQKANASPLLPVAAVQPLVIRANLGDCIEVCLENQLDAPVSMHIQGLRYDPFNSDGAAAGFNPPTLARPRRKIRYRWYAEREGVFYFGDLGDPVSGEHSSHANGLWGALVVEPPGATWTDPETGEPLAAGCYADIHLPAEPHFREYVIFMHDEMVVRTKAGEVPIDPMNGMEQDTGMFINYRTEPSRIRHHGAAHGGDEHQNTFGENAMMSSWPHGDPATPVLRGYIGDPARIRLVHAGVKETHVYHLHVYQWRLNPDDPKSTLIDSISIGPQETYTIVPLYGAGSLQGAPGDAIWHCHLYPHFDEGMWGLWRAHDVLEDGSRHYPDGSPITALQPLPDRTPPPAPTATKPGYPLYIPGTFGHLAPRPPLSIVGGRDPTPLELANFAPDPVPGAAFVNPGPPGAPIREFEIVAIQLPITYNNDGWHDPQGRCFVLAEDEAAVLAGTKPVEPLVIRANAGDIIDVRFTNKLPTTIGGTVFQTLHATDEAALHIHLVKFDVMCSDGAANGWNYDSGAGFGETTRYRWYADTELRTVFFHDHLYANSHQQHGVFAALIIEPAGSTHHHPETGLPINSGTKAVIRNPNLPDFREFVLYVHDFALLFDGDGNPLNPPEVPGSHDDPGVMGVNYRCEPFHLRRGGDPAYVFSSWVHGDPVTPLLEAYAGDPVRIRLIDGAHEEQHVFNLHGHRWLREPTDSQSPLVETQTIGISEAFNLEFQANDRAIDQDYLYYFGGMDDMWLGLWGILRVYGQAMPHLQPLADRPEPAARSVPFPVKNGQPPAAKPGPGDPAPADAPVRRYDIVAMSRRIVYNRFGDNDPNGLLFVPAEDAVAVAAGLMAPRPLVIRANLGDRVDIRLHNRLPEHLPETIHPEVPVQQPWPASNRVSLHAQGVRYDGQGSAGVNIGFTLEQTAAPGETIEYRWFAAEEGTHILSSWGDVRNHRHHGLFGVLVVEPWGANYRHPASGRRISSGAAAVVRAPGRAPFREFVVIAHNGISLFDRRGVRIPDPADLDDAEDQGWKGFNYRSERFANRLRGFAGHSLALSSWVHGDPATPILRAYTGDPVMIRYAMPADKPRNTVFLLHGHHWQSQPDDSLSGVISTQGAVSVGNTFNIWLDGGAGGTGGRPGDYLYRSGVLTWDIDSGMWGILRVYRSTRSGLLRL